MLNNAEKLVESLLEELRSAEADLKRIDYSIIEDSNQRRALYVEAFTKIKKIRNWGKDLHRMCEEIRGLFPLPDPSISIIIHQTNDSNGASPLRDISPESTVFSPVTSEHEEKATEKLLSIVKDANVEEVTQLILEGADVNTANEYGVTPLMLAAQDNSNPDVVRTLIDKGADVNAADKIGMTPLMFAALENSNTETLRILIGEGANINAANEDGWTSLMLAASNNSNPAILQVLLVNGAEVNIKNSEGKNALDCADDNADLKETDAYYLLRRKTISCQDLLPFARKDNNETNESEFISNEINVNEITEEATEKPTEELLSVVMNATLAEVTRLIQEGADVNVVDKDGWTSLMRAAWQNTNPEILRILIDKGANINAGNKYGQTPLLWAASSNSNPEVLSLLIKKGANVNVVDKYGRTPLMLAAGYNVNLDVLNILIDKNAKVNAVDKNGRTPLMCAARFNPNADVLLTLIEKGANTAMRDKNGKRALDYAGENEALKGTSAHNFLREKTL